jgi:hypothetical protein
MGIRYMKKQASLEEIVTVEDAEGLLEWLKKQPKPAVNLSKCQHMHAAVLQVLLTCRPAINGAINDPLLARALMPSAP